MKVSSARGKGKRRGFVRGAAMLLAALSMSGNMAVAQGTNQYARWEHDPSWNDLTNHIQGCYRALVDRCQVAGIDTNAVPIPTYAYPMYDYRRFADFIGGICPNFVVCQTNGVPIADFGQHVATGWTASELLREVGATNWATSMQCWVACDRRIQVQIGDALRLLRYTRKVAVCDGMERRRWAGYGWADAQDATRNGWDQETDGRRYNNPTMDLPANSDAGWPYAVVNSAAEPANWRGIVGATNGWYWQPWTPSSTPQTSTNETRPGWTYKWNLTTSGGVTGWAGTPYGGADGLFSYGLSLITVTLDRAGLVGGTGYSIPSFWAGVRVTNLVNTVDRQFAHFVVDQSFQGGSTVARTLWGYYVVDALEYVDAYINAKRGGGTIRMTAGISTNYPCRRDLYLKGTYPPGTYMEYGRQYGYAILPDQFEWAAEVGPLYVDRFAKVYSAPLSIETNAAYTGMCLTQAPFAGERVVQKGWAVERGIWLLDWQFPAVPLPGPHQPVELADSDADGIVDVGANLESFGPDTGTIVQRPEMDRPEVLIPMARTPLWSANLPIHVYLSQGAFSYLPYAYYVVPMWYYYDGGNPFPSGSLYTYWIDRFNLDDGDGPYQALSINTRVIENVCVMAGAERYKRVVVLRPRGNVVVFEFPWDEVRSGFSPIGHPTGVNAGRTYVLHDLTPDNHADFEYDLSFESGVIHSFSLNFREGYWLAWRQEGFGWLAGISHIDGRVGAVSDTVFVTTLPSLLQKIPGCYIRGLNNHMMLAEDGRYSCSNVWAGAVLQQLTYWRKDGTTNLVCTPIYDSRGRITALRKTGVPGIEQSDVSISADERTVAYSWGTVTRDQTAPAGTARTVTFNQTTVNPAPVTVRREWDFNADDRLVESRALANGDTARTIFTLATGGGRYANRLPVNSRVSRVTYPDSSCAEFGYDPTNGWLTSATTPIGNGLSRVTTYAYATHGVDDSGDRANPTNLVERPRTVAEYVGSAMAGRTLYSYRGPNQVVAQVCTNAGALWNWPGNLAVTNIYLDWDDETDTPRETSAISWMPSQEVTPLVSGGWSYNWSTYHGSIVAADLSAGNGDSQGRGQSVRINAFGNITSSASSEDGVVLSSAASTTDPFGRILRTDYLDGTFTSNGQYCLWGPRVVRERDGSETVYEYTDWGQVKTVSRPALDRSMAYEYDGLGNVTKTTETAGGRNRVVSCTYDAQGRLTSRTTPLGATTRVYQPTANGMRRTTTNPDGSVLIEDFNFDGSPAEVRGSAALAHLKYNYGVDGNGFYTEEIRVADNGAETEKSRTYRNMLGAASRTVAPAAGGGEAAWESCFDSFGRYSGSVDPAGIRNVTQYNGKNEVSDAGQHVNGASPGQLQPDSEDRFQTHTRAVGANGVAGSTRVYPQANDGTSALLSESLAALDGRSGSSSFAGQTNAWGRSGYAAGGCYSETNTLGDGRRTVSEYKKWRLDKVTRYDRNRVPVETESCEYYEFGELRRVVNSLHGVTTYEREPDTGLLTRVIPSDAGKGVTSYTYVEHTDRLKRVMRSDGAVTSYEYYPNGLLKREYDIGSHDVRYTYDSQGRRKTQTTLRNGNAVVTQWDYQARTGALERKIVNGVVVERYEYRDDGRLASVTDADGITATCRYSERTGDLEGVVTSDDAGSAASASVDRMGRVIGMSVLGGIGESVAYALDGSVLTNRVAGNGLVADAEVSRAYDPDHGGLVALGWRTGAAGDNAMTVGYDSAVRVSTIAAGDLRIHYGYATNSSFVSSVAVSCNGSNVLEKTVDWDLLNERIRGMSYVAGGKGVAGYGYAYPTNSDRVAGMAQADGTQWFYEYDLKGQLTFGGRYTGDSVAVPGMQFAYEYDEIGNMTRGGPLGEDGLPLYSFEADDFNFHTNRVWGRRVPIGGLAGEGVNVSVNTIPAQQALHQSLRHGAGQALNQSLQDGAGWFSVLVPVDNAAGSLQTNLTVWAVKTNVTPEMVASASGAVYVAQAAEPVTHRATGVLARDSRFSYEWNPFGRLVSVTSSNASPNFKVTFDYYADGRRARKMVYKDVGGAWSLVRRHEFFYDGWNLIAEDVADYSHTPTLHYSLAFLWGLDLEGQRTGQLEGEASAEPGAGPALHRAEGSGAGGIGGLLAIVRTSNGVSRTYLPIGDHSGTIRAVLDADTGQVVAEYEYGPFGALVSESYPVSSFEFPVSSLLFQSKYYDRETGLYYFGYRYYDPATAKWLSRDPKGESGGINLTCFCRNDPVNQVDPLGLAGYFFGGTGNSLKPEGISNVEILYRAWDESANGHRWYVSGVFSGVQPDGEDNGLLDTMGMPLEGAWGKTLGDRAGEMMRLLETELQAGDKEVNVFGFSRGSPTALEFLNRIQDKVAQGDTRYKGIRIRFVALWDAVKHTAVKYRTELPKGMKFMYQPLHFIALDEQREEFYDKEVLDLQGALQIGYRGVHADVGGGYPNSAFDWLSRNDAVYAAGLTGLKFDSATLKKYPYIVNWHAKPTRNDKWFYNGNESRSFPADMYLHWSVHMFGWYSQPLNSIQGHKELSKEVWMKWARQK